MEESSNSVMGFVSSPGQPRLALKMAMDLSVRLEGHPSTVELLCSLIYQIEKMSM